MSVLDDRAIRGELQQALLCVRVAIAAGERVGYGSNFLAVLRGIEKDLVFAIGELS